MIVGGGPTFSIVEALYPDGTYMCQMPDIPDERSRHTTNGLLTCGGDKTPDTCITFTDGDWIQSHTLLHNRVYHTSWETKLGVVLIGGGSSDRTSEIVVEGTSTTFEGFELKYRTKYKHYSYILN